MQKIYTYILFLFIGSFNCQATTVPQIINFDKSTYQAHSQNWSITQTPNAYLYSGNSSGMLEFDGQQWELYSLPEKQKVRAVAATKEGRIFVGGYAEFGYWEEDESGLLAYQSLSQNSAIESIKTEEIWHILVHGDDAFFQSFGTIYKYDAVVDKVEEIRPPANILFAQLVDNRILIPGIHGAIYEWSASKGYQALPGLELLANKRTSFMIPLNGGLLIGTKLQGLFWFKNGQCTPYAHPLNEHFKRYEINCGLRLKDGRLAIGTILNGIYLLDDQAQSLHHINKEMGLQNNTVLNLFEDREHNLWVGLDSGIDLLILNESLVYFHDKTGELGTVYAATIFEDQLYIGTNHGVFFRKLADTNSDFQLLEGSQGQVWEFKIVDHQLICGHNLGTFRIEAEQFIQISPVTGGWSTLALSQDRLLQATYTGLVLFEKDSRGQWIFSRRISGLNEPIEKLLQEDELHFWVLHPYRGLKRVAIDSGFSKIETTQRFTLEDGLSTEFNLDLYKINNDLIIRSGDKYLVWTNQQLNDCSDIYRIPITAASNLIEGVGQDWFKTQNGQLEWWHNSQLQQKLRTGLVVGEVRILPLDEQRYLLCLEDKYIILDKSDTFTSSPYPPPQIKRIEQSKYPNHQAIDRTATNSIIPPNWNTLRFTFASPVFTQKVLFRYRLSPIYPEWSVWDPNTSKEFSNLPKGAYIFELQSNVTDSSTSYAFTIQPKWYETVWAKLLFIGLLVAVLVLLWHWHQLRMRYQQRRLETEKERLLHQQRIQAKNERLQQDLQNKSREIANSTFNLVQKNEILMQIKDRLDRLKQEVGIQFPGKQYNSLIRLINDQLHSRKDWDLFEENFNEVHQDFFRRLKKVHPTLTPGDLRLAAYLRMNLSSKEIAPLLFITIRGVENKRYRLRKKIALPNEDNLTEYLITF